MYFSTEEKRILDKVWNKGSNKLFCGILIIQIVDIINFLNKNI